MTKSERWVCTVLAILVFGGLVAYCWWTIAVPMSPAGHDYRPFFLPVVVGIMFYLGASVVLMNSPSVRRAGTGEISESPVWRRYRFTVYCPLAGAWLFALVFLVGGPWGTMFFFDLFFLPTMCLVYALYFSKMSGALETALWAFGVPVQYLVLGLAIDALRRTEDCRRRAEGLLALAGCLAALVLYFALWADPHHPESDYPTPGELAALVVAYAVIIALIVWVALTLLRRYRGGATAPLPGPPLTPCAGEESHRSAKEMGTEA